MCISTNPPSSPTQEQKKQLCSAHASLVHIHREWLMQIKKTKCDCHTIHEGFLGMGAYFLNLASYLTFNWLLQLRQTMCECPETVSYLLFEQFICLYLLRHKRHPRNYWPDFDKTWLSDVSYSEESAFHTIRVICQRGLTANKWNHISSLVWHTRDANPRDKFPHIDTWF